MQNARSDLQRTGAPSRSRLRWLGEVGGVVASGELMAEAEDFGFDAKSAQTARKRYGGEAGTGAAGAGAGLLREGGKGLGELRGGKAGCAGLGEDLADGRQKLRVES